MRIMGEHTSTARATGASRTLPLDYRRPGTGTLPNGRLARLLRERESLFWIKISAMLIFGVALCFIGPAMLAMFARSVAMKNGTDANFAAWFAVGSVTIIPVLFLVEWRTRGKFFEQSIEANSFWLAGPTSSYGIWEARQAAGSILIIEVLLAAPRMTLNAIGQFLRRKQLGDVSLHRAGEIVTILQQVDGRVGLRQLARKDETPVDFCRVLRYLTFYDWIDIAKDGKHVWLLSEARRTLQSRGITSQ